MPALADRFLAEMIKGIDVIVGRYSHTKIERSVLIEDTTMVQAWEHGKALGVFLNKNDEEEKIKSLEDYLAQFPNEDFKE